MSIRRFAAHWSPATWLLTVLCIGIVIVATGAVLSQIANIVPDDEAMRERLSLAVMVIPFALMVAALFAPLGYTVDNMGIIVNRLGPKVCILHSEIKEIARVDRRQIGFSLRLLGSGGFMGSYGRFWSAGLGKYRAYMTNSKDLVLITRHNGERFLLSPFPADGFLEAVEDGRGAQT